MGENYGLKEVLVSLLRCIILAFFVLGATLQRQFLVIFKVIQQLPVFNTGNGHIIEA